MAGLYVACWLSPEQAERLYCGGEEPEALHVTLCYLGELDDLPANAFDVAQAAVRNLATQQPPLAGTVPGFGVFRGGDRDVFWAALDVPGLAELRHRVCARIRSAGLPVESEHGFTPHVTLAYLDPGAPIELGPWDPTEISLDTISVVTSDDLQRHDFPLEVQEPPPAEYAAQVLKADDERQVIYGIVLEPDVEDSQGDVVAAEDIELAAWRFLYTRAPIGLQHAVEAPESVRPVESFLVPSDFVVDTPRGPELVRRGSWILAVHIPDPELWALAKNGGFGGWSVAGMGRRTPLALEAASARTKSRVGR